MFSLSLKKSQPDAAPEDGAPDDGPLDDDAAAVKSALGARLRAWWNGYELDPGAEPPAKPAPKKKKKKKKEKPAKGAKDGAAGKTKKSSMREELKQQALPAKESSTPWPETRCKIAQLVWGDGFISPGAGADGIVRIMEPLGLDSSASVIEIGAGMGGGARALTMRSKAYVTAWEVEKELADEGADQSIALELDAKAAVSHLDLENIDFKQNFYSAALVREILPRIEDKTAFVKAIVDSVKIGGQIVIWDKFFEDDASGRAFDEWSGGEETQVYSWSLDTAKKCLAENNIEVRVVEDDTDLYCAMAQHAWKEFVELISSDPLTPEMVIPMKRDAELWARRVAAMQSGAVRLMRVVGIKNKAVE